MAGLLPERARKETPTTSIYFAVPMADDLARAGGPLQVLEPNVFACANQHVIMRHWSKATQKYLAEHPGVEITYFIDDDLWALDQENGLPEAYVERLQKLKAQFEVHLRPRAARIVSPSAQILAHFPELETELLAPAMIHPLPPLDHHDDPEGAIRLVFCGTASHLADLALISDQLADLLGNEGFHLTTFLGRQVPAELQLPNSTHHAPQSWAHYRETVAASRFHIGLAPMRPTQFNQARSATRLLDHAAFGAAGLYSDTPPFSQLIECGVDGMLAGREAAGWTKAIRQLADEPALRRRLASEGQGTAARIGELGRVRQFWRGLLGL
ncbi:MAG: glycosyltransferase family 4 protein [Alphaproteobacteria bacterium]|nr:glycosyltransferase family 4 protein [Alphaproteobacteria bacterium]